ILEPLSGRLPEEQLIHDRTGRTGSRRLPDARMVNARIAVAYWSHRMRTDYSAPFTEGQAPPGHPFLTMDELRQIQEHLLRFSPDALIVVDASASIRFANETVRELLGYEPQALIGQPIDVLIPPRLRGQHGMHMAGYMRKPKGREMG